MNGNRPCTLAESGLTLSIVCKIWAVHKRETSELWTQCGYG